jgi:GAF domain/ANTAR domain
MAREDLLARTFVDLADVWPDDFDLARVSTMVAQRCTQLFDASAAGVLLADANGHLRVSGSSSHRMHRTELFQAQSGEGPCFDCYQAGKPVVGPDLSRTRRRWPHFTPVAMAAGYRAVHAVPVRVRDHVIGALNLFRTETGHLSGADMLAAQALAQATAFTILRQPPAGESAGPPRPALDDQLVVEQAKGVLAGRAGVSIDEAFDRIRRYARHHDLDLVSVCHDIVDGTLTLVTSVEASAKRHRDRTS